jgi:hypothetical protein
MNGALTLEKLEKLAWKTAVCCRDLQAAARHFIPDKRAVRAKFMSKLDDLGSDDICDVRLSDE